MMLHRRHHRRVYDVAYRSAVSLLVPFSICSVGVFWKSNNISVRQAEELIKREMIVMQRYDGLHDPVPSTAPAALQQYRSYLDTHPYQQVQEQDMQQVSTQYMEYSDYLCMRTLYFIRAAAVSFVLYVRRIVYSSWLGRIV